MVKEDSNLGDIDRLRLKVIDVLLKHRERVLHHPTNLRVVQ